MKNRPFALPPPEMEHSPVFESWGDLRNKFPAKVLFSNNLYRLVSGDLEILSQVNNSWFVDELFTSALKNSDPNLIPALKKITDDASYSESQRQRASEIIEIIEDRTAFKGGNGRIVTTGTPEEKAAAARSLLAGIRYPQATDILRLLREKSLELKRLALFMIGKFGMTDMVQEVCECLTTPGIEKDARSVLVSFGNSAGNELRRFYFLSSGNTSLSRTLLRIHAGICPDEQVQFLAERLWSTSRQLKEISLSALLKCRYVPGSEEKEKLYSLIIEVFSLIARIASWRLSLLENKNLLLFTEVDRDYNRWKRFLLNLLRLTFGSEIPARLEKEAPGKEQNLKLIPELAAVVFDTTSYDDRRGTPEPARERKPFKKLQRWFGSVVPEYSELPENILNYDYNVLSIWTKACTLRTLPVVGSEAMAESVKALLFSPETILRQEAAHLLARSGEGHYESVAGRIPGDLRNGLDEIAEGSADENQMLFVITRFLTRIFPGIIEDELLYLAERMIFVRGGTPGPGSELPEGILWSFPDRRQEPVVSVIHGNEEMTGTIRAGMANRAFFYLLPFTAAEDFGFQFPENFIRILKFIDDKEE